jgi:hypothetical protein
MIPIVKMQKKSNIRNCSIVNTLTHPAIKRGTTLSSSLAIAIPDQGLAFAADIKILLAERPVSIEALRRRINHAGQGDGRRELLDAHHMLVASDAFLALGAAELVIDPSSCRERYVGRLHQLATRCGDIRLVRPSYDASIELEMIELTIDAIKCTITSQSGLGRAAKVTQYQRVLNKLRTRAGQLLNLQVA